MSGLIIDRMAVHVSSPVLIGRSNELDRLRAALQLAHDGRSSATLVAGEAGVGKTRLVTELAEQARAEGAVVLLGGCILLGDGALPFAPVVEALRGFVRRAQPDELDAVLGSGRSELARLVPDLGPVAEESASGLSIGSAQGRLFELLLGFLERLAARSPVVFIVEDLHWSDRSTRDLLAFLVRNLRDTPVMLVFTYRSDELHRRHPLLAFLAELDRTGRIERLDLRPFDSRESSAQLRAIAGRDLDTDLIESIHARSGGNAFFAEELLVAAGKDGRTELPPTLRDLLLARVAELAEPTQEFLRVASAAGQRVDPGLLATAAGMDESAIYEALRECVSRQVLVPDPTAGLDRYAFRHALLQEAVYDDLLPGERTRLHSAFARTLEASGSAGEAPRVAELAYHWYAAHDLPRALASAVAAGDAADAGYAFPEALAQYERAIELWDQVPDAEARAGRDRIDVLAALASVARFHEPARGVSHIQTAIALVDEAADPVRRGLLNERLGRYAWIAGQGELANQAYRDAMRLIPPEPPSEARARAVAGLAQILMLGGRFEESRGLAEEALSLARALGARDIEGHALNTSGTDRAVTGDVEAALEDIRAAVAIAVEVDLVDDVGRAYANWAYILDIAGCLEEAVDVTEVGIAQAEHLGLMRFFGVHMLCNAGDYLYRLGRWEESERAAHRADEIGPLGINEILTQELLGRLAMAHGRFGEAAERLRPLAPLAERAADIQFIGPVQASLAELALWQGRPDDAATQVTAVVRMIDFTPEVKLGEGYALGLRANADAAELARARRSPDQERQAVAAGEELLAAIRGRHADVVATRPPFEQQSEAWLLLCEAEATRLHRRADPDIWVAAAQAWEGLRRPYAVAYVRWREAEARLAGRGNRALAAGALRAALDIAERLGAEPLVGAIKALAARARLSLEPDLRADEEPRAADEAARLGLTVREREVLVLVALGRTNRQIADALFISENTAGVHVSNILGKLGVKGRGEAAAVAYRLGIVESASEPA
jgi:DNA-binding CsgD family transcriptional regulator/tetratricopeptide (TPR) repeat protein